MKSRFIMNGVCVQLKGWVDLKRLDGVARLEFDYDQAAVNMQRFIRGAKKISALISVIVGYGLPCVTKQKCLRASRHVPSLLRNAPKRQWKFKIKYPKKAVFSKSIWIFAKTKCNLDLEVWKILPFMAIRCLSSLTSGPESCPPIHNY